MSELTVDHISVIDKPIKASVVLASKLTRTLLIPNKAGMATVRIDNYQAKIDYPERRFPVIHHDVSKISINYELPGGGGGAATYTSRFDEIDLNSFYFGEAAPGSVESNAVWRIRKVIDRLSDMEVLWAGGDNGFVNKWTDRAGLSYS